MANRREHRLVFEPLEQRILLAASRLGLNLVDPGVSVATVSAVTNSIVNDPTRTNWSHLSSTLQDLYEERTVAVDRELVADSLIIDDMGRVAVTIWADDITALVSTLEEIGYQESSTLDWAKASDGWLPIDVMPHVARLGELGLRGILPQYPVIARAGNVLTQGDLALRTDRVRDFMFGGQPIDGTGVTVAVISNSYGVNGNSGAELPGDVLLVQEGEAGDSDEGRAMLEIIHDIAPGAKLAFSAATGGYTENAVRLETLVNQAKAMWPLNELIVVDDIGSITEADFQESPWGAAIERLVATENIAYFSAAGNAGNSAWENVDSAGARLPFTTTVGEEIDNGTQIINGPFYQFQNIGGVADYRQRIKVPPLGKGFHQIALSWNEPRGNVQTDLDIYLLDPDPTKNLIRYSGTDDNLTQQDAIEIVSFQNDTLEAREFDLVIHHYAGPAPSHVRLMSEVRVTTLDNATNSPTIYGHTAAISSMAVGAAPYWNQAVPESFSAHGPATLLYNLNGFAFLPQFVVRDKPDFTAIDKADTSFFGQSDLDQNGFLNFAGTSASAPHAAAVAALVWQVNNALTAPQLYQQLRDTAFNIEIPGERADGWDKATGFGMVDAFRAVFGDPVPIHVSTLPGKTFVEDFESGLLGKHWEVNTKGAGYVFVTDADEASHVAKTATLIDLNEALGEMVMHVDLTGMSNIVLQYEQREYGNPDEPMSVKFDGHENSDGVALSIDGKIWYRIDNLIDRASRRRFHSHFIDLTKFANDNGLALGSNVRIKFQNYDANGFGFGLDNIAVFEKQVDGYVFEDKAAFNGLRGAQEKSIDKVKVEVHRKSDNALIKTVNPDDKGYFVIGGLPVGVEYYLQFVPTGRMTALSPLNPQLLPAQNRTADFLVPPLSGPLPHFEVGFTSGLTESQRLTVIEALRTAEPALKQALLKSTNGTLLTIPGFGQVPFLGDQITKSLAANGLMEQLVALLYERPKIIAETAPVGPTLSADAYFRVNIDGRTPAEISVAATATQTNTTLVDLASDINAAIAAAGLEDVLFAEVDSGKLVLASLQTGGPPTLSVATLRLTGTSNPVAFGQLSQDVEFSIDVYRGSNNTPVDIEILKSITADNANATELAADLTALLAGSGIAASVNRQGRLALVAVDPQITRIVLNQSGAQLGPLSELGFTNGGTSKRRFSRHRRRFRRSALSALTSPLHQILTPSIRWRSPWKRRTPHLAAKHSTTK